MGFDDGQIIFENPNETFFAGQVVKGRLVFHQSKRKTFRSLYMVMKGYCNVHWSTSHSRRVNDRTEHYTVNHNSHEVYFEERVYLVGSHKGGDCHLEIGDHSFPFQCLIPPHCPSSFEGSHGHVRYEVKFIVDRSFKFDQEMKRSINVVAQRDLNMEPYCKEPVVFEFEESYCCWCMNAGICEITVKLPQSGFCAGQSIPIEVGCANNSNVDIDQIKFEINEEITFHATHEPGTKHENSTVAKLKKGPIPANTTRNWTLQMEIPDADVYNLDSCKYIDIDHEFEVSFETSGCHSDNSGSRRIVLGHIPLREFEDPPNQHVPLLENPAAYPQANNPYPGANTGYPNTSPYPSANPVYPNATPYPNNTPGYPSVTPYPGAPPQPGPNPPYPGANPPYPGANPPYPGANPPYPIANPPYPSAMPSNPGSTFPVPVPAPPSLGFGVPDGHKQDATMPLLPTTTPYPATPMAHAPPYVNASAPEPGTPDFEGNKSLPQPAYNPDFSDKSGEEKK